jgi:cyclase
MGLAHRVIPVLLKRGSFLVKGKKFDSRRVVGNVYQAASIYQARGVDELIVIDVGVTMNAMEPDYEAIKILTHDCFMPITVGGGIKSIDHVRRLLASGADKVVIGTGIFEDPTLVQKCARKFGSQAITVAIDVTYDGFNWFLTSRCGTETHFFSPVTFAEIQASKGAGELIVTSINNDGMMCGYDLGLIRKIAKAVDIPVIANGGAGTYRHMHSALKAGASAVAAGAMFQWTDQTPHGAAEYLAEKGWEMRL